MVYTGTCHQLELGLTSGLHPKLIGQQVIIYSQLRLILTDAGGPFWDFLTCQKFSNFSLCYNYFLDQNLTAMPVSIKITHPYSVFHWHIKLLRVNQLSHTNVPGSENHLRASTNGHRPGSLTFQTGNLAT